MRCSSRWPPAIADRTSLARAARGSRTWRRSGNNSGRFDAAGLCGPLPKGREAQPPIYTQSHEQFVTCHPTPKGRIYPVKSRRRRLWSLSCFSGASASPPSAGSSSKSPSGCEGTGQRWPLVGARSSPLGRIFYDQDRRRPMPRHGDLASAVDDPVRAPAATAAPSAIACSPRPRDRMGPHRRARLAQRRPRRCLRAGHVTNVSAPNHDHS